MKLRKNLSVDEVKKNRTKVLFVLVYFPHLHKNYFISLRILLNFVYRLSLWAYYWKLESRCVKILWFSGPRYDISLRYRRSSFPISLIDYLWQFDTHKCSFLSFFCSTFKTEYFMKNAVHHHWVKLQKRCHHLQFISNKTNENEFNWKS